jgi:DNA replication and repair protein RecF
MSLNRIRLLDFRNYTRAELDSIPRVCVLSGANGSGKTNFLEAVHILARLEPVRPVPLSELVRWGATAFHVDGELGGEKMEVGFSSQKKVVKRGGESVTIGEYKSLYPVIGFLPDDILVVNGSPEERRAYLDRALSSMDPEYAAALSRYNRTLRQRNAQLRVRPREASIWDAELAKNGSILIVRRIAFAQFLARELSERYRELYGEGVEVRYLNTFRIERSVEESFRVALEKGRVLEAEKRYTLAGPHRDNLEVLSGANGKGTRSFASQGQRRVLSLFLQLCVAIAARKAGGISPILLLDDVLLEVDEARRKRFLAMLPADSQIFATVLDPSALCGAFSDARVLRVEGGKMEG